METYESPHGGHVLLRLSHRRQTGTREGRLLGAGHLGQARHRRLGGLRGRLYRRPGGGEQRRSGRAALGGQRQQQVGGFDVGVVLAGRGGRSLGEGLLGPGGQLQVHDVLMPFCAWNEVTVSNNLIKVESIPLKSTC